MRTQAERVEGKGKSWGFCMKENRFFKAIDCFNSRELEAVVNEHLDNGWVLVNILESKSEFFQVYSVHLLKKGKAKNPWIEKQ